MIISRNLKIAMAVSIGVLSLAACGTTAKAPAPAPAATTSAPAVTDSAGNTCTALDAAGYCPGDDPAPAAATSAPAVTDSAGNTCTALDAAGYCPGDDPAPVATVDPATAGQVCNDLEIMAKVGGGADPQTVQTALGLTAAQVTQAIAQQCPQYG
jgi:hypothetical protein